MHIFGKIKSSKQLSNYIRGAVVKPNGTDFILRCEGNQALVSVKEGTVDVITASGETITVPAGKQFDVTTGVLDTYTMANDPLRLMDDIPSESITMDDANPQSYGEYVLDKYTFKRDWIWQDPNEDVTTVFQEDGSLAITVPNDNDLWGASNTAPKLLHKVTGDFELTGDVQLTSNGTDFVGTEFVLFSPGSAIGYRAWSINATRKRSGFSYYWWRLGQTIWFK